MDQKLEHKKEIVVLSLKELEEKIVEILRSHIGQDNYITKKDIFYKIFGNPKNYTDIELWKIWFRMFPKAFNWLRRTTHCFIVNKRIEEFKFGYYIPKSREDIVPYDTMLKTNIKKMNYMRGRAEKAVAEKWYLEFKP